MTIMEPQKKSYTKESLFKIVFVKHGVKFSIKAPSLFLDVMILNRIIKGVRLIHIVF
jgi:hypothetical protein